MENLKTQFNKYLPHAIKGSLGVLLLIVIFFVGIANAKETYPEMKQNKEERNEQIEDEIRQKREEISVLEEEYGSNEEEIHAYNLIIEGDAILRKKNSQNKLTQNEE